MDKTIREYIENLIEPKESCLIELGGKKGFWFDLEIDWLETKTIKFAGTTIIEGDKPVIPELVGLDWNEEVDPTEQLLGRLIKSGHRYDTVKTGSSGFTLYDGSGLNDVFPPFPYKYYKEFNLVNTDPWLKGKLKLDIYIYSKLATNNPWEVWNKSKFPGDRYWLHKPDVLAPFCVVFDKKYLW